MRQQAQAQMEREQQLEEGRREAEEDLQIRGEPMHLREDLKEVYATMPEEERERLRQLMERYKGNIDRHPDLYGNFIHSVFTRALLEQQMKMEDAGWAWTRATRNWACSTGISPSFGMWRSPGPLR